MNTQNEYSTERGPFDGKKSRKGKWEGILAADVSSRIIPKVTTTKKRTAKPTYDLVTRPTSGHSLYDTEKEMPKGSLITYAQWQETKYSFDAWKEHPQLGDEWRIKVTEKVTSNFKGW